MACIYINHPDSNEERYYNESRDINLSNFEISIISNAVRANMKDKLVKWLSTKDDEKEDPRMIELRRSEFAKALLAWVIFEKKPFVDVLKYFEDFPEYPFIEEIVIGFMVFPEYEFDSELLPIGAKEG